MFNVGDSITRLDGTRFIFAACDNSSVSPPNRSAAMSHRFWPACLAALAVVLASGPARGQTVEGGVRVYQTVLKSSVWIVSDRGSGQTAYGSGSLIDRQRKLVLTNYHVVGDIDRVTVFFPAFRNDKVVAERSYYNQHRQELSIGGTVRAR